MRDALGRVQSVLVLGGGSDLGLAVAGALVAEGARSVVLAGRRPAALEQAAGPLRAAGAEVAVEPWDADDAAGHASWAADVFARHGDLDVVVAAAGVLGDQARAERDPAAAAALLHTNCTGLAAALVAVAVPLRAQGHGALVVLSSIAAVRPRRANFAYAASKAGLDAFAQGLGDALAGSGIQVLVVRPGFVHTKMTAGREPAPFATSPEAVARATLAGLASGAHTAWAPGVLRWVAPVLRALPRPLWRKVGA